MHQIQKYEPGDPRRLKGAGDELKARLVDREVGLLLRNFIDQLERMNPEERVQHAAHRGSYMVEIPAIQSLSRTQSSMQC